MRTLFILLPILASLYGAAAPSVGEIDTVETLMNFRVVRGNVWKDPQTDRPLHRLNHRNELVQAACDADITFTTETTPFNAGAIMGGYLASTGSSSSSNLPQATTRSSVLSALVADQKWNAFLTLAKNYRVSQGRIARDCFGRELFEVGASSGSGSGVATERKPAADVRDIIDISTLIAAIEPAIREAGMPAAAGAALVFTAAELSNYESLLAFRVGRSVMSVEPRTGQQLYRVVNDVLVAAAKDGDVLPDLSNLVALMVASTMSSPMATSVGTISCTLTSLFSDENLNRLYQLVENSRRGQGRLLVDAIGRPLYKAGLGTREQIVNMFDITDTASLLKAVFGFFPEGVRPTIPAGI
ncbi:MAG: hypothetical protein WCJ92_07805 [Alphaproteobacteria bacterium]